MYVVLTDEEIQCEMIGVYPNKLDAYIEELNEEVNHKTYPVIEMYKVPVRKNRYKRKKLNQ